MRWKLSSTLYQPCIRTKMNVTSFQQPINLPPEKGPCSEKGPYSEKAIESKIKIFLDPQGSFLLLS